MKYKIRPAIVVFLSISMLILPKDVLGNGGVETIVHAKGKNIILISLDTLRRDHVGIYGYSKKTTPFIDSLGANGIVFENAFSNSPATVPSHATMFTGYYPPATGVLTMGDSLDDAFETLAETVKKNGYRTAAFLGWNFAKASNLTQGFDYVESFSGEKPFKGNSVFQAKIVWEKAKQWLQQRDATKPFFLFLHYFDIHEGYLLPEKMPFTDEQWQQYADKYQLFALTKEDAARFNLNKRNQRTAPANEIGEATGDYLQLSEGKAAPSLRELIELYDGQIQEADDYLSLLFKELETLEILNNTLIVITSDHGEGLGEHGYLLHNPNLFEEQLQIPLIIYGKGFIPILKIKEKIELVDLYPTLCSFLDIKIKDGLEGRSYNNKILATPPFTLPHMSKETTYGFTDYLLYQKNESEPQNFFSITDSTYKLIYSLNEERQSLLFNLQKDPNEHENIPRYHDEKFENLRQKLSRFRKYYTENGLRRIRKHESFRDASEEEELLQQLKSLGYT